jgi:type II secretion system protein G
MSVSSQRGGGFTLIELLIVVAIIAILAAIAVPNFLEAQVRSKVSRAKSDMRTLATALEAYRVDNPDYPWHVRSWDPGPGLLHRLKPLTTPIAFITSIPLDPFYVKLTYPGSPFDKDTYDYFDLASASTDHPWLFTLYGRPWRVSSAGPDMKQRWGSQPPYDSSNGTKSYGDIIRFQGSSDDNYLPLMPPGWVWAPDGPPGTP